MRRFAPVHVLPVNDLREHVESADCWCEPQVLVEPGPAKVVVHHSLDGREHRE